MLRRAENRGYARLDVFDITKQLHILKIVSQWQRYSNLFSVGVYGDFVPPEEFAPALELLEEKCVVAVAGRLEGLADLPELLRRNGFQEMVRKSRFAHYTEWNSRVDYLYVVASRN